MAMMEDKINRLVEILNEAKVIISELDGCLPKVKRSLMDPEKIKAISISDFGFSFRAVNVLNRMKIKTLGEITKYTEEDLLAQEKCGRITAIEIERMLNEVGLRLAE